MDFRAAKIVLVVFLFIAFAMPFARIPGTSPHPKGNDDVRNGMYYAPVTTNPSMAFTRLNALPDSTSRRVGAMGLTDK
jgi:hypothetical protein